jgi:hypothetical protein
VGVNLVKDKQKPRSSGIRATGMRFATTACRSTPMLRVITERLRDGHRLDLHGTLGGEWVAVLEQQWRSILQETPSARVTVGLANVDFIDAGGEALLQRMADDGVEFVVAGCMNRYVIDSVRPRVDAAEGGR